MTLLLILSTLATVAILVTYALMVRRPGARTERWFNIANALGAPATIAVEIVTGAWTVLPLTLAFGLIGAWGWWKAHTAPQTPQEAPDARARYHSALREYSDARRDYMATIR